MLMSIFSLKNNTDSIFIAFGSASKMATKIHDVPETISIADRRLRDGTLLRYQLKVLQQPQRARACGMGAKCKLCSNFAHNVYFSDN